MWYLPPHSLPMHSNPSSNSDNMYSFVTGKQRLFPFRIAASFIISHVDILTSSKFGCRAFTLVWTYETKVEAGSVTTGKSM